MGNFFNCYMSAPLRSPSRIQPHSSDVKYCLTDRLIDSLLKVGTLLVTTYKKATNRKKYII